MGLARVWQSRCFFLTIYSLLACYRFVYTLPPFTMRSEPRQTCELTLEYLTSFSSFYMLSYLVLLTHHHPLVQGGSQCFQPTQIVHYPWSIHINRSIQTQIGSLATPEVSTNMDKQPNEQKSKLSPHYPIRNRSTLYQTSTDTPHNHEPR